MRHACRRHLKDLTDGPARGLVWRPDLVERVLGFFKEVLRLNGGEFEGLPYEPLPWQAFIIGSLFGWLSADGFRRFRVAYIETGKGNGKSPMIAGIGIYGLMADGEPRAEIYAGATKKDQAMILFRDAVAMVDQSPLLSRHITKSGGGLNVWNLAYMRTGSFFRPISADDGQSGPRPHIALLDEIHEHRNRYVVDMMKAGQKGRRQPLMVMITNSGSDKRSVCFQFHEYAGKVTSGSVEDDRFFGYVCALDEADDPFVDKACWPKANPSLGITIKNQYLEDQILPARSMPSQEAMVRRLNFCQWTEAESPWISREIWEACAGGMPDEVLLRGRRCFGGLDLSSTQDLTSLVLLFEPTEADPVWRQRAWFWLPNDGLFEKGERDKVDYIVWRNQGHLLTTPGKAIDKMAIVRQCAVLGAAYDIQSIAYDRWRYEDMSPLLEREGVELPLVPFGQGFKDMSPALDEYERMLLSELLAHDSNPVMGWCAANAVTVTDPAGNRKLSKERATGRIDGMVAAIMAAGASQQTVDKPCNDIFVSL
ncbi:MAG: terminase TerL endonuclease subunit [Pseudomonadota bacterium]